MKIVYKELIPDHYVGPQVTIIIKCRQKDANSLFIQHIEAEIDCLLYAWRQVDEGQMF